MKKLFLFMSWVMLILSGCADEDIIERNSPSFPLDVHVEQADYEMSDKTIPLKVSGILKSPKIRYNAP